MFFGDETFPDDNLFEPEDYVPFDLTPIEERHPNNPNSFIYYYERLALWDGEGTNEVAGNVFETKGYVRTVKAARLTEDDFIALRDGEARPVRDGPVLHEETGYLIKSTLAGQTTYTKTVNLPRQIVVMVNGEHEEGEDSQTYTFEFQDTDGEDSFDIIYGPHLRESLKMRSYRMTYNFEKDEDDLTLAYEELMRID